MALPRWLPSDFEAGPAESGVSSAIEFQSPQLSQRPDHLVLRAPQFEQTKLGVFAMHWVMHERAGGVKRQM